MATPTVRDVHRESYLEGISIAFRNTKYIWDQVFPVVPVNKKTDAYFIFPRDAWFRDEIEVRAPGTRARRVDYDLTSASYNAITYAIDKGVADSRTESLQTVMFA